MVAVSKGSMECFQLLLKKTDCTIKDKYDFHLIHLACGGGNTELVQHLLTSSNINRRGVHGWTPIMLAAGVGQQGVFDLLVSHNADLTLVDDVGNSLLHQACTGGNTEIVRHRLTPSNINSRGQYGYTPIMYAAFKGHIHIIDLLVENQADLKLVTTDGKDVVTIALDEKRPDVAEYLKTLLRNPNK